MLSRRAEDIRDGKLYLDLQRRDLGGNRQDADVTPNVRTQINTQTCHQRFGVRLGTYRYVLRIKYRFAHRPPPSTTI